MEITGDTLTGALSSLFQPDIMTREQFRGTRQSESKLHGVKKLYQAILEDAIRCLRSRGRDLREARAWVEGAGDPRYSIVFEDLCDFLGLEPTSLRAQLIKNAAEIKVQRAAPVISRSPKITENRGRTRHDRRMDRKRDAARPRG